MWTWLAVPVAIVGIIAVAGALGASRRRRRSYHDAIVLWQQTAPTQRRAVLEKHVDGADFSAPAWYLLGCAYLQEGRPRLAARAFGVAHHADWQLESAALLTFACLKAAEGPDSDVIQQAVQTWREMREPDLFHHVPDRIMLTGLAATAPALPPLLSPLGQLIWLTVSESQRRRVETMAANGSATAALLRR
jgi:hypothetical protein